MKKNLFKLMVAAACLVIAFAVAAAAQDNEPFTGGYGKISVKSAEARKAAATAIAQHARSHPKDKVSLVKILKAEQQVVAGMNYRVCLSVMDRHGLRRTVTAVVYYPIRKKPKLTDWLRGGCYDAVN